MKSYNVVMNGKTYAFRTNANLSVVKVICCDTARLITSEKTMAKLLARFPESEQFQQDHVFALAINVMFDAKPYSKTAAAFVVETIDNNEAPIGALKRFLCVFDEALEINKQIKRKPASYFQAFKGVSTEQLARFESYMCKAMKASINKVCGDLWLMAEGELVARQFEVATHA